MRGSIPSLRSVMPYFVIFPGGKISMVPPPYVHPNKVREMLRKGLRTWYAQGARRGEFRQGAVRPGKARRGRGCKSTPQLALSLVGGWITF